MVDKRGLKKNIFRHEIILALIILGVLVYVFAAFTPTITTSTKGSNNSGTINVTCNNTDNDIQDMINASVYYNRSGGQIYSTPTYRLANATNSTGGNSSFINVTINTASFSDSSVYNISCTLCNSTTCFNSTAVQNVTFDNTPPKVTNITMGAIGDGGYVNGTVSLNVSVNDSVISSLYVPTFQSHYVDKMRGVGSVYFNITNSSENQIVGNFTRATNHSHMWNGSYWNATVNTSGFLDGVYNITVWANETTGEASFTVNENKSEHIQLTIDNTAPSLTYTCSPSSVQVGQLVTCTCTGEDGAGSGVNHTTDTTTTSSTSQIVTEITTTSAASFSRTCTVKDRVGKTTSATATYTVTSAGSTSTTTGAVSGTTTSTSKTTISDASTPVVMKGFSEDTSVKEIKVETSESASNVEIKVTKTDTKPAEVSVDRTEGKNYKYLHIETKNLENKLSKATIRIQVEKLWISNNALSKGDIALFKFDETDNIWNELTTTYAEEDDTYHYYDIELTSFSYFAIGEKKTSAGAEGGTAGDEIVGEEKPALEIEWWVWTIVGVAVLVIIGWIIFSKKRK